MISFRRKKEEKASRFHSTKLLQSSWNKWQQVREIMPHQIHLLQWLPSNQANKQRNSKDETNLWPRARFQSRHNLIHPNLCFPSHSLPLDQMKTIQSIGGGGGGGSGIAVSFTQVVKPPLLSRVLMVFLVRLCYLVTVLNLGTDCISKVQDLLDKAEVKTLSLISVNDSP